MKRDQAPEPPPPTGTPSLSNRAIGDGGEPLCATGWRRAWQTAGYTVEADGAFHDTVLFHKTL